MKPIKDTTLDALEDIAFEGAKHLRAFFTYEGDNPRYFQKAKVAATAISGYARIRASETNRLAVELAVRRTPPELTT
jgi:hypothetical protein